MNAVPAATKTGLRVPVPVTGNYTRVGVLPKCRHGSARVSYHCRGGDLGRRCGSTVPAARLSLLQSQNYRFRNVAYLLPSYVGDVAVRRAVHTEGHARCAFQNLKKETGGNP